jgi:hypothetical protein
MYFISQFAVSCPAAIILIDNIQRFNTIHFLELSEDQTPCQGNGRGKLPYIVMGSISVGQRSFHQDGFSPLVIVSISMSHTLQAGSHMIMTQC